MSERTTASPEIQRTKTGSNAQRETRPSLPDRNAPHDHVLLLQGTLGNRAVQRMLRSGALDANIIQRTPDAASPDSSAPQTLSEDEFIAKISSEPPPKSLSPKEVEQLDEAVKQYYESLKKRDQDMRDAAVAKAKSLMGADWHAAPGTEARKKADSLYAGDPYALRLQALTLAMKTAQERRSDITSKINAAKSVLDNPKLKPGAKAQAAKVYEAGNDVIAALDAYASSVAVDEKTASGGPFELAWRSLGSEKAKKHFETLGIPIPWFTTCVTLPAPVVKAAGVDMSKWGPLDMFANKERFKQLEGRNAWIPAEFRTSPEPGDILVFVTYPMTKGEPQKGIATATFQHVAVLLEPVAKVADAAVPDMELWKTADGGKGLSHEGQDKTATTERYYIPSKGEFVRGPKSANEAALGGRYLLGFWSLPRLPRLDEKTETDKKKK